MKIVEEKSKVAEKAEEYFHNGYHCAESVVAAVLEEFGEEHQEAVAHATAFGGGFGRSFGDACGALSGALVTIGHLHGRREPGENWDIPANLGASIREHFIEKNGTAHCGTLRERFGEEQQMEECGKLTGELASALFKILKEHESMNR